MSAVLDCHRAARPSSASGFAPLAMRKYSASDMARRAWALAGRESVVGAVVAHTNGAVDLGRGARARPRSGGDTAETEAVEWMSWRAAAASEGR